MNTFTPLPFNLLQLYPFISAAGESCYLFHSLSSYHGTVTNLQPLAEIDLREETDLVYTWECTRSNEGFCEDTNDRTPGGWFLFGILMFTFLSKDVICGLKLVTVSGKRRQSYNQRARFFVGGLLLCCINIVSSIWDMLLYLSLTT